ncbi:hypothetical protein Pst134EA_015572 [Puccinia striiformis f. sp. tritici]|uniref:Galactose oxidase-like Early set domain-containing protein n=2 Tax=Puccinia striiformis TaxID=27350 RepID=A0A2S4VKA9_9BASI|nr:hypothetical protein Pst134EA_015572 [Puccinia striiformis f. sp. tritici]KAH9463489.1 hypothetical protein Pst134EA_015572 [Puccinia striiformis f. sp. tritici]POW09981.1 hypothetical protein PSTT_06433 [Puccinia striiformis]
MRYSYFLMHLAVAGMCQLLEPIGATPESLNGVPPIQAPSDRWSRIVKGHTGVSAMQITVVSDKYAVILDKVEQNPLKINGQRAWASLYNFETDEVTPLELKSNSFCAGGSFLGNGTLINFGGNPVGKAPVTPGNFGPTNGLQSIRFYTPCDDGNCPMSEFDSMKLTSPRWYATATRLPDGTIMIVGGSKKASFRNFAAINNPTIEYFPPRQMQFSTERRKTQVHSPFLDRTLISNLFPIVITLPSPGLVFMAANRDAIIYDYKTNQEYPLPRIPNGVRVTYPMTGGGLLLPLSPQNGYKPEVLICGGSTLDETLPTNLIKVTAPASTQCVRMVLTRSGIKQGWKVEQMPQARIMPDMIQMPDGKVLIVNGAQTGVAGFGSLEGMTGNSHADSPSFTPVLYDPEAPLGQRFSSKGLPSTNIARLYHSVATLAPSGLVMLAGSNPNPEVTTKNYRTEYRVEWLSPPYIKDPNRPKILALPKIADYNQKIVVQIAKMELAQQKVEAVLLDLGFVTHSTHMNSRLVRLQTSVDPATKELEVIMPPSPEIYPPGYGWLFVLVNGVPSPGKRIMVGSGKLNSS